MHIVEATSASSVSTHRRRIVGNFGFVSLTFKTVVRLKFTKYSVNRMNYASEQKFGFQLKFL